MVDKNETVVGNVEIIELENITQLTPIYNRQPIVHIRGNGQTLRIRVDNPKGIAIGGEYVQFKDGTWVIKSISKLQELRVDNVNIIVDSPNKCFSLGNYNEQNNVKIVTMNGGSIKCPETKNHSLLLYQAEPAIGSIGYTGDAKYILSESEDGFYFCEEQENVILNDMALLSKVNCHTSPNMIKFIKATNITPSKGYYDENIPKVFSDMMRAAIAFGVDEDNVWETYKAVSPYRHVLLFRKHIRELMYDVIYPDWRNSTFVKDMSDGKLFRIFELAKKPKPIVNRDNYWIYKYLLPPGWVEDNIDSLKDSLRLGLGPEREKALSMFVSKRFKNRDKVTTKPIVSMNNDVKFWKCGKMANGILAYDTKEKLSMYCNTAFPFTSIMRMRGDEVFLGNIVYRTITYILSEDYKGLPKGTYTTDNTSKLSKKKLSILEDAVNNKIAVKRKDDPMFNYHGREYYLEVLDYV